MNSDSYKPNQDRVSIVQGGYVSSSGSNQLSVSKKANILNKASASRGGASNALAPGGGGGGGGNHSSANNNEASNDAGAPAAIFTVRLTRCRLCLTHHHHSLYRRRIIATYSMRFAK